MAEAAGTLTAEARPAHEVELKLLASAEAFAQVREAPAIRRHACNAGVSRHLEATYYDTLDQLLHRRGLSLRVRRNGRRYVQTLKSSPSPGQPFTRGEWETPVDGPVPDLGRLPRAAIGPLLDGLTPDVLAAIFATKVRRRTRRLDVAGTVVEVAFDEGCIEAGQRREPLREIELEMKAGDARALYDLGLELIATTPLRIGMRSKSDRGYDLALGLEPHAVKATSPTLAADCCVDDVAATLLGACQHQVLANQAAAESGRDPEGVHQMRVALRRLRTVIVLLQRELGASTFRALGDDAKWLAQCLGPARDWDVFLTETLREPQEALGGEIDFDALRRQAEQYRTAAYAVLREALASQRATRFHLTLLRWIEMRGWRNELADRPLAVLVEPGQVLAGRVLARLHRKVLRRGRQFRHLPPEQRHRVRIALKKLRYALEFFQDLLDCPSDELRHFSRALSRLQDELGRENDAATTAAHLGIVADNATSPEVERSIGAILGWQARQRLETGHTAHEHWCRFKAATPVWSR